MHKGNARRSIFLVLPSTLLVQLIDDLLPTSKYLQSPALVVVISSLWHKKVCHHGPSNHEGTHHLQHVTEILALPVILLALIVVLESIR